jgi:TRAP transporter 4TM/12TM fusion protein
LLTVVPIITLPFILNIPSRLGISFWIEQYLCVFLGLILFSVFLLVPVTRKSDRRKLAWYDALLALLSLIAAGYLVVYFPEFQIFTGGFVIPSAVVMGTLCILLLLEATRRLFGWPLVIVTLIFIIYALLAEHFPPPFTSRSIPFPRLMQSLYVDNNALTGITLKVAATLVMAFVIFGRFLFVTKGGAFLIDLALALFGRKKGGSAKATIAGSSFFGSFTGIAVANVYTTGSVTIPMMKKYGIDAETAAAVEATASTGSLILPPVMGIVAFIMALYLRQTYEAVCLAAIVPALLYYVGVYVQADRYAAKNNLPPLSPSEIPSLSGTLRQGWFFFIAFGVLIFTLFIMNWDAEYCALISAVCLGLLAMFRKETRLNWRKLALTFEGIGEAILDIGTVCALVGLIVGCLLFSGLALSLADAFITLSSGHLLPLLIMSGVACIILGMGLPIVTVYIVVVIILVPALDSMNVNPFAAHMFVFYYAMLSFLTPPVMLSVFVASALARSRNMATAVKAMRFAIAAYIVPFAFVLDPYLLLQGDVSLRMVYSIFSAFVGIIILGIGLEGYWGKNMSALARLAATAGGLAAISPFPAAKAGGIFIGIIFLLKGLHLRYRSAH